MSNGATGVVGATQVVAPTPQPVLDQIYGHINGNNELIRTLTQDVRAFITRANGHILAVAPTADTPTPEGIVNLISEHLNTQSQCIQELRGAVNELPEIA